MSVVLIGFVIGYLIMAIAVAGVCYTETKKIFTPGSAEHHLYLRDKDDFEKDEFIDIVSKMQKLKYRNAVLFSFSWTVGFFWPMAVVYGAFRTK